MARRQLQAVLLDFSRRLEEARKLAADAYQWSLPSSHGKRPYISAKRRDSLTELAFLRAFLAWERFLEESFILYLLGHQAPHGPAVRRHAFPPSHGAATEWLIPEGRHYAQWTDAATVRTRAERLFKSGRPFAPVLSGNQNVLEEARKIRNAIAHESSNAQARLENLARAKLGVLPLKFSVGRFLTSGVPGSSPPLSFLDFYFDKIEFAAKRIVP